MKKYNKIIVLLAIMSAVSYSTLAQTTGQKIGSNPTIKEASAAFEVEAANKGLLMPRIALTSTIDVTTIADPANALTIFNTATTAFGNILDVTPGYYYYRKDLVTPANSRWVRLIDDTTKAWDLKGNAGTDTATNFLGTTDDNDLKFRVNNKQIAWFTSDDSNGRTNYSSIFVGQYAGIGAGGARNAVFVGLTAGFQAANTISSNFLGESSGIQATNAYSSNFIGANAGSRAVNSNNSNFMGTNAGSSSSNSFQSNFFGWKAGNASKNADNSNFMGNNAGTLTEAKYSNFIGYFAGNGAVNATFSSFIGGNAGRDAINATNSIIIGNDAGYGAQNAANSIFIGRGAGEGDNVDNRTIVTDVNGSIVPTYLNSSILLGNRSSTGGFSNSIAIGAFAVNTAENQLMIGDPVFNATRIADGAQQYDMVNPKYPETRVDTATTTPINFLYTDANGKFLSAPIAAAMPELNISTQTADYTVLTTDETILVDATGGVVKITLPAANASNKRRKFIVKKVDASVNDVNVISAGGTIDGNAAATGVTGTLPWQGWVFQSDGANWYIVSRI